VPAHISERDATDDATGADRNVVNITARITWPGRHGMHPSHETRQLDETRGPLVSGPCFGTLEAPGH
jgi:hypothetical protein